MACLLVNAFLLISLICLLSTPETAGFLHRSRNIYVRVQNSAHKSNPNVYLETYAHVFANGEEVKCSPANELRVKFPDLYSKIFREEAYRTAGIFDLASCKFGRKMSSITIKIFYEYVRDNDRITTNFYSVDLNIPAHELKQILKGQIRGKHYELDIGKLEGAKFRIDVKLEHVLGSGKFMELESVNVIGWKNKDMAIKREGGTTLNCMHSSTFDSKDYIVGWEMLHIIKISQSFNLGKCTLGNEANQAPLSLKIRYNIRKITRNECYKVKPKGENVIYADIWKETAAMREYMSPTGPNERGLLVHVDKNFNVTMKLQRAYVSTE